MSSKTRAVSEIVGPAVPREPLKPRADTEFGERRTKPALQKRCSWPAQRFPAQSDIVDSPPGIECSEELQRWKQVGKLVGVIAHHVHPHAYRDCLEEEELSPEAILELTRLRKGFWQTPIDPECKQDTSDAALARAWGGGGSWQVFGRLPALNGLGQRRERPLSQRALQLHPRAGGAGQPAAILRRCGVAAVTMKGRKDVGDLSPGQDNFSVTRLASGWECFVVTDGHGPDGHWPSHRAAQALPFFLQQEECVSLLRSGRVAEALKKAFLRAEQDLEFHGHEERIKLYISGSTATCVLRRPGSDAVWVASVGDSRAALLAAAADQGAAILQQTRDHHPSVPSELQRCLEMGCEMQETKHDDGEVERRLFVKGKGYPGLCMTRTLGDLSVKGTGVICTPEVVEWTAEAGSQMLIASDGLWELLPMEEIARTLLCSLESGRPRQEAVEELAQMAKEVWMRTQDGYCDDITVVLVPMDQGLIALDSTRCSPSACVAGVSRLCAGSR